VYGGNESVHGEPWPRFDAEKLLQEQVTIAVQINGKMRGTITIPNDLDEDSVVAYAKADPTLKDKIASDIKKVVYVPRKILNLVLNE
jgi:leucyl-tRNA synthetase